MAAKFSSSRFVEIHHTCVTLDRSKIPTLTYSEGPPWPSDGVKSVKPSAPSLRVWAKRSTRPRKTRRGSRPSPRCRETAPGRICVRSFSR